MLTEDTCTFRVNWVDIERNVRKRDRDREWAVCVYKC